MGMAASQVRFLSLQNRKNTIGLNLTTLSNRKLALSRDMNRVANEYNNAMNEKTLKWSNDSGITYNNLSYDTLMKPNNLNSTMPYILTDAQGRVVLDDTNIKIDGLNTGVTYRDLGMMISAYSGYDVDNKETTYNNLNNLIGGSGLTAANIKDANITDKATSGVANSEGYEIVSTAGQTASNSLRYDLMQKLGLISPTDVTIIEDLNNEIGIKDENGKYDPDTLTGQYYLAQLTYDAYYDFCHSGEYQFATGLSKTQTISKTEDTYDGNSEITYTNRIDGTQHTSITFDYTSAASENIDLSKLNQSIEESLTTDSNMKYQIDNTTGTLTFKYETPDDYDLLNAMSVANVSWDGSYETSDQGQFSGQILQGYTDGDDRFQRNFVNVNSKTWAELIDGNSVIILYGREWDGNLSEADNGLPDKTNSYDLDTEESRAANNLKNFITAMGNALKSNNLCEIDNQAMDDAVTSTIAFFKGDITNDGKVTYEGRPRRKFAWRVYKENRDNTNNKNIIEWNGKPDQNSAWTNKKHGVELVTISARNAYNVLLTFYNYYAGKRLNNENDYVVITNADTAAQAAHIEEATQTTEVKPVAIPQPNTKGTFLSTETFVQGGKTYTVNGYRTERFTNGSSVESTFIYDYLNDANELIQRVTIYGYVDDRLNGKPQYEIEIDYYDRENGPNGYSGAGAKSYYFMETAKVNKGDLLRDYSGDFNLKNIYTNLSESNLSSLLYNYTEFDESKLGEGTTNSDGILTLSGKNINGEETEYVIKTFDSNTSVYTNNIIAKPKVDYKLLNELKNAVDTAKAALDAKIEKRDQFFDSTENKMMMYFDALFKMIAENGWVYDENVNNGNTEQNTNYLNAKLQNNMYFITEVDTLDGTDFNYSTKLATNVSKVFQVYDKDAQNAAISKYEAESAEKKKKKKQVDLRMNKLEAEQDAIATELDSIKKIIEDNVSNTFKIFT